MTRRDCGCPASPPDWRGDLDLGGMLVHEQPVPMFLHMPVGFEAMRERQLADVARLELHERWPGFVLLRPAAFRGALVLPLAEQHSPARRIVRLPAPFHVRAVLHEGGVASLKGTIRAMQRELLEEAKMPRELYLAYLNCPRCDRGEGPRVLVVRRWEESARLARRLRR